MESQDDTALPFRLSYSIEECATLTGLSKATLYRRIADHQLKTVRRGRRRLVPVAQLESFLRPEDSQVSDPP